MKNTFLIKMIISFSIGLAIFSTSYAKTILHDNKVRFLYGDTTQPDDTFKITNFTVERYSVTPNQPWDGVSVSGTNELNVRAGRKGNSVHNGFLRDNHYNVKNNGNGKTINFAVIGNLSFSITSPYATSTYTCSNIALQQTHAYDGPFAEINFWSFYSNQIDKFRHPAVAILQAVHSATTITCQNMQTNTMNDFKVVANDTNLFNISPVTN